MRVLALRLAGVAFLALVLTACAGRTSASPEETIGEGPEPAEVSDVGGPPPTIDQEALIDSSWTLAFGGGPDGELMALDRWPITITFDSEFVTGVAGCNGYRGRYTISGTQIQVDEIGSVDEGCASEAQEFEQSFLSAVADVDGIDIVQDELILYGPASELIFRRAED